MGLLTKLRAMPVGKRLAYIQEMAFEISKFEKFNQEWLSDTSIDVTLRQYPLEIARLAEHFRRPLADRIVPLKPTFSSGDQAPTPWFGVFWPELSKFAAVSVKHALQRQQLAAALAFLDQGEVGLTAQPNPLTGKPFMLVQKGGLRGLVADIPGNTIRLELWIGQRPSIKEDGGEGAKGIDPNPKF
jgi:hypothetical protein